LELLFRRSFLRKGERVLGHGLPVLSIRGKKGLEEKNCIQEKILFQLCHILEMIVNKIESSRE
jgi:hypothetical protein